MRDSGVAKLVAMAVMMILLGSTSLATAQTIVFTTEQAPADSSGASALVSDGYSLFFFRSGVGSSADGQLYVSDYGLSGSWYQLPSITDSLSGTEAGEIYGGAMAYWLTGDQLLVSRWRDPSLGGTYPWDNERVVAFDLYNTEWVLVDGGDNVELNSGLTVIGDTLYGIQHGGGSPFRRVDLLGTGLDEGTGISGVSGDDSSWFSRVSKLTVADDGTIYGIKNDFVTNPAGSGDRLFAIDPADWGTDSGATPAVDLGSIPFEVGAGAAIVALPAEWSSGGQGALFIMAGMSPSDGEGDWYSTTSMSDLYAIYDLASGSFVIGYLPGPTGRGASAVFHDGMLYIKRGLDENGYYSTDLWVGYPDFEDITDLDVTLIERTPRYDFDATQNQPAVGETVTFHGHVRNLSTHDIASVEYRWDLDGVPVDSGTLINLLPGEDRVVTWSWSWQSDNHHIRLVVDPDDDIEELSESNNQIEDRTNGIIVGFWVEQSVYDYFGQYQRELGVGSNSWEDWAQRQMLHWNQLCEEAVYPLSPNGVLDRVRIDKIVVVPDGALPLGPWGLATNHPDVTDKTVDMMWGFTTDGLSGTFYSDHTTVSWDNPFYHESSLLHELGHARYLIDLYAFDVHDGQVFITEGGEPVAGSDLMPFIAYDSVLYYNHNGGIMTGPYSGWSPYEAVALNLIAGQRAVCGNYNAPCNIGVFLQDLPTHNHVEFVDRYNRPRSGAAISVYQATSQAGVWYGKNFDDIPDSMHTSDSGGQVDLGTNPFSDDPISLSYELSNGVIILRIEHDGQVWYRFVESADFNMEYWAGNTTDAYYTIKLEGTEHLAADVDDDGDVDLNDYASFVDCLHGPSVTVDASCQWADLDGTTTVDMADAALFCEVFTGETD